MTSPKFANAILWLALILTLSLAGCERTPTEGDLLKVVASTTLVGDVVSQVGGDLVQLAMLIPSGADPHTFEPRPQDLAAISDAEVVFINGLGLEEALQPALKANLRGVLVQVSDRIEPLSLVDEHAQGGSRASEQDDHRHTGNPHTWMDPNNVKVWAKNIAEALVAADPPNAAAYRKNAEAYISLLSDLDSWIRSEVAQVPPERRKLVTDHATLDYFASEYGFEQVGLVIPSFSSNASPSAQDLKSLEDAILSQKAPAVFLDKTANANLAAQVARDTGVKLVFIYTGSLSEPGGPADNYLKFMRFNVNAIMAALK